MVFQAARQTSSSKDYETNDRTFQRRDDILNPESGGNELEYLCSKTRIHPIFQDSVHLTDWILTFYRIYFKLHAY